MTAVLSCLPAPKFCWFVSVGPLWCNMLTHVLYVLHRSVSPCKNKCTKETALTEYPHHLE